MTSLSLSTNRGPKVLTLDFPLLCGVVEFNVGGTGELKATDFVSLKKLTGN
jgi:hypothetical protein